jgi:hypothetical protein
VFNAGHDVGTPITVIGILSHPGGGSSGARLNECRSGSKKYPIAQESSFQEWAFFYSHPIYGYAFKETLSKPNMEYWV